MTTENHQLLEAIIDKEGLYATLDALSGICGLKAEHIAMLERKMLVRKIFDQFGVPRLSLFYLPLN